MKVAVAQPRPGIGDMIWHLPHIRAIAAHVGGPVTLIAKPRSAADQIFGGEDTVRDVFWLDRNPDGRPGRHDGVSGSPRLLRALRGQGFTAIYVLHHSKTLACLAMLAGIPARYGYGYGAQRCFLNRPPVLAGAVFQEHPFEQASRWLRAAGIPMAEAEPRLPVTAAALASVRARAGLAGQPVAGQPVAGQPVAGQPVALGIGSSEPYKQWGAERFAALADALAPIPVILVGGGAEAALAAEIQARCRIARPSPAIGWSLADVAALFSLCAFYAGNDTGVMNMAAAVGLRTYGLFGAVPPFHHSSRIVPILPPGGVSKADGMQRLSVDQVLRVVEADQALVSAPPVERSRC